ncbi:MAG: hypothetical protein M3275_03730 [Thermoproteota archaeon]|nr:hypothetical protein [Thermoproteota archaeon]
MRNRTLRAALALATVSALTLGSAPAMAHEEKAVAESAASFSSMATLGLETLRGTKINLFGRTIELDPVVDAVNGVMYDAEHTPEIEFVKNIAYPNGSDIEFGEFTVTKLDENGTPVCRTDAEGNCEVDEDGNIVYETEQRDYAFAGAHDNPSSVRIVDITDPEEAFVAATIPCNLYQADVQVRVDLGLLLIAQDRNTNACGFGNSQGFAIFDVSDPRSPEFLSVFKSTRAVAVSGAGGGHNVTFHPTEPLVYISDSDVLNTSLGQIPVVDVSDPRNPKLVTTFEFNTHSPHDITFNAKGDRAYTSSITHSDILDTSDPRNPKLISSVQDQSINIHHQTDPTPDGKFMIISDELAGAAAGPVCPGGGLHIYDISNEAAPVKTGVFFPQHVTTAPQLCTAHVFRINPDGRSLTIGWYNGGTRVVDITHPRGAGFTEIASMIPTGLGGNTAVANSWASKMYKGYIYSNDRNRGLDIMRWTQHGTYLGGGRVAAGHPLTKDGAGASELSGSLTCEDTSGVDASWVQIPEEFADGTHTLEVNGRSSGAYDLDLIWYTPDCGWMDAGDLIGSESDPKGTIPEGAGYAAVSAAGGTNIVFTAMAE